MLAPSFVDLLPADFYAHFTLSFIHVYIRYQLKLHSIYADSASRLLHVFVHHAHAFCGSEDVVKNIH